MKKIIRFFQDKQKRMNFCVWVLFLLSCAVIIWGVRSNMEPVHMTVDDGIEQVDLDTIHLKASDVEVSFSDVLLSDHEETRKLIVSKQSATVKTELTDKLIQILDIGLLKKTQQVSYTGTGFFVVDLAKLTPADIVQDKKARTVTIRIPHPHLEAIEINPYNIIIDEVKQGLLARGEIKLTVKDYNEIEKQLRTRLTEKFDTAENGQKADTIALKMVKEVYEPMIKAVDRRYDVTVVFK